MSDVAASFSRVSHVLSGNLVRHGVRFSYTSNKLQQPPWHTSLLGVRLCSHCSLCLFIKNRVVFVVEDNVNQTSFKQPVSRFVSSLRCMIRTWHAS